MPRRGWALIRVKAFGLNRSELHTRLGLAQGVTFPRVPGIEATGEVVACPSGEYGRRPAGGGHDGGISRTFDGGYAEFTLSLAFSFGLYGLTKKKVGASLEAMHLLAAETVVLSPIAVLVLGILVARGETTFLDHGTGHTSLPVLPGWSPPCRCCCSPPPPDACRS